MEGQKKCQEGIRVAIRMRPLNQRERDAGQEPIFRSQTNYNAVSQIKPDGQPIEGQTSYFDKVFDEKASNADVYGYVSSEMVEGVMRGINGTVFAYGQTSSGKTHTMIGEEEKGVVYLAAEDIFRYIAAHPTRDFILRASFVEIYNETIRDLLSETPDATVNIREDPRKGVYCEAEEVSVTDFDSIIRLLKKGISRRVVESTAMNETSSRSHSIFKLVVESRESVRAGVETDCAVLVSALNLVDLAGSESVKHTGAVGQRAKEGGKINQSLLYLRKVITALSVPGAFVPYRDSKLTRLLQPSLAGNAKMSIVCCITSAQAYLEETRSTLAFASSAKLVVTNAKVNEVVTESTQIRRLKTELDALKAAYKAPPADVVRLQSDRDRLQAEVLRLQQQLADQESLVNDSTSSDDASTVADGESVQVVEEAVTMKEVCGQKRSRRTWHAPDRDALLALPQEPLDMQSPDLGNCLLVDLTNKVSDQDKVVRELSNKLSEAQDQIGCLQIELDANSATIMLDREYELMEEKATLASEKERLHAEVAALQDQLRASKEEVIALKNADFAKQQAANLVVEEMQKQIEQLTAAMAQAEAVAVETQKQLADALAAQKDQLDAITAEKDEALHQISALREEADNQGVEMDRALQAAADREAVLSQELSAKVELMAEMQTNVNTLEGQLASAELTSEELRDGMEVIQGKLVAEQEQVQLLQAQLMEQSTAIADRDASLVKVTAQADELCHELEGAQASLTAVQEQLVALGEEMSAVEEREQSLLAQVAALQANASAAASDAEQAALAQVAELEEQKAAIGCALHESQHREQSLTQQLADQESVIQQLNQTIESNQSGDAAQRMEQDRLQQELLELQRVLEEVTVEKDQLICANQIKQEQISAMEEQLDMQAAEAKEQVAEHELALQSAQELLAHQMAMVEDLRQLLEKSQEQEAALTEHVAEVDQLLEAAQAVAIETQSALEAAQESLDASKEREQSLQEQVQCLESELLEVGQSAAEGMVSKSELEKLQCALPDGNEAASIAQQQVHRLEAEVADRDASLAKVTAQADELRHELEGAQASLTAVQEQLVALGEEMAAVEEREQSLLAQVAALQAIASAAASDAEQAALMQVAELEEQKTAIACALHEAQDREQSLHQQLTDKESTLSDSTAQIHALQGQVALSEQTITKLTQAIETGQAQLAQTQAQLAIKDKELLSAQQVQYGGLNRLAEMELSQEQIHSARRELQAKLEGMQTELRFKEGEYSRMLNESMEMKSRCKAAEEALAQYQANANGMTDTDAAAKKRISQLNTENDLLKGERDQMTNKLRALEQNLQGNENSFVLKTEKIEQAMSTLTAKYQKLEAESMDQVRRLDQVIILEKALASARDEVKALHHAKEGLQGELSALKADLKAKASEVSELQYAVSGMSRLTSLEQDKASLTNDLAETNARYKKMKDEKNLLERDLERLQGELNEALLELQGAAERMQELTVALEEAEACNLEGAQEDSNTADKIALQDQILELEGLYEEAQNNFLAAEQEKEQLAQEVNTLQAELQAKDVLVNADEDVQAQLQDKEAQLIATEEELRAALQAAEDRAEEVQVLTEELQDKGQQLQDKEEKLAETIAIGQQRIADLLQEQKELQEKLAGYDRNASKEQEMIMAAADIQMDSLRLQIEEGLQAIAKEQAANAVLQRSEQALMIQVDKLLAAQEGNTEASKMANELTRLRQELSIAKLEISRKTEELQEAARTLEAKDVRIAHLDASKLTKDQMDKIKLIKEERKEYMEKSKTLKKQLERMKTAYDEMKESRSTAVAAPSSDFVISDLKFQLTEVKGELARAQEMTSLIKEKLKDCSESLRDHEKDRVAVMEVLEKHGVDIRGLLVMDDSVGSIDLNPDAVQDLGEAVAQMANKLITSQATVSARNNTASAELVQVQAELNTLLLEGAEAAAAKAALEKRLDSAKATARTLREENASYAAQVAELQEKLTAMGVQLQEAQKKALIGAGSSSTEVQVLEEEVLDLMKENKELRVEVSKLRAMASSAGTAAAKPVSVVVPMATAPSAPAAAAAVPSASIGQKRAFGTELDANVPVLPSAASSLPAVLKSASKSKPVGEENAATVPVKQQQPVRRTRAKVADGAAETPECTQS